MRNAILIAGLGWGDEGKGSITDFLARQYRSPLVVRYNGGSQAAHHVVIPGGDVHCFSQFGSGSLAGSATYLSQHMLVDPFDMEPEAEHLSQLGVSALDRTVIDSRALVITPFHKAANRIRESLRGAGRHGSCGRGIGECRGYHLAYGDEALFIGDLASRDIAFCKLHLLRERLAADLGHHALASGVQHAGVFIATDVIRDIAEDYLRFFERAATCTGLPGDLLKNPQQIVLFEGAQGVLLDETHGVSPPHVTWTDTTYGNADTICAEAEIDKRYRLGILRAYHTRHGAGPFPSESERLTELIRDPHNGVGPWQGVFRVGWFDLEMARYALDVCGGVDGLALTCLDQVESAGIGWKALIGGKVRQVAASEREFIEWVESELGAQVVITSDGPTFADKRIRGELPFMSESTKPLDRCAS